MSDVICLQECSEAWREVAFHALQSASDKWEGHAGFQLFTAWNKERFRMVSTAMLPVFPDPADCHNARRKFRKFQEALYY